MVGVRVPKLGHWSRQYLNRQYLIPYLNRQYLNHRTGLNVLMGALLTLLVLVSPGHPVKILPSIGVVGVSPRTAADQAPPPARPAPRPVSPDLIRHAPQDTRDNPDGPRVVVLTFDDGPHPEYTPQVLDLLARHNAVATFCMLGSEVRRYPHLVRDVVAAGMRLCAHTITHDQNLVTWPEAQITAEIVGSRDAILDALTAADAATVSVDYFRAPYGIWSEPVQRIAAQHGMRPLSWSVDPRDWSRPGAGQIVAHVRQHVEPGSVILLHDGGGNREQTVAALEELLPWLVEQGYQFDIPG